MEILTHPNELLRVKVPEFPLESLNMPQLLALKDKCEEMFGLMWKDDGIGLAATQVGLLLRLFVTSDQSMTSIVINPSWRPSVISKKVIVEEGCLSFPDKVVKVKRYDAIKASWVDIAGNKVSRRIKGFPAQVFQHETEHLNGVLMIDHKDYSKKGVCNEKG